MIDHSGCDHPRTPSARAKCRRERSGGASPSSSTPRRTRRSSQTPNAAWSGPLCSDPECIHGSCYRIRYQEMPETTRYGQTPRHREDECQVCHVERVEFIGRDAYTNMMARVGEKCAWRVKRSQEFRALPA